MQLGLNHVKQNIFVKSHGKSESFSICENKHTPNIKINIICYHPIPMLSSFGVFVFVAMVCRIYSVATHEWHIFVSWISGFNYHSDVFWYCGHV